MKIIISNKDVGILLKKSQLENFLARFPFVYTNILIKWHSHISLQGEIKLKKDNMIVIRVTKQEKERLIKKSQKAEMTLSKYLIEQGLEREIVIIEDVKNLVYELRKIGNNINQLTHLANSGVIKKVYLNEFKSDLKKIWNVLNCISL